MKDTSGPAFPVPIAGCTDGCVYDSIQQSGGKNGGMTLRDYFAAKAMQVYAKTWAEGSRIHEKVVADLSYKMADEMLAARKDSPDEKE